MNRKDATDRLLFVSRVRRPGGENDVRLVIENTFPAKAFERAGVVGFTVHMGGGYCIVEYGFESPFAPIFERLSADAEATRFLADLGELVDPAPRIDPGGTAHQPVAADVFLWRKDTGIRTRSVS